MCTILYKLLQHLEAIAENIYVSYMLVKKLYKFWNKARVRRGFYSTDVSYKGPDCN